MRIIVLAGGDGDEREVSLSSGERIAAALLTKKHQVTLLDLSKDLPLFSSFEELCTYQKEHAVEKSNLQLKNEHKIEKRIGLNLIAACAQADIVFLALHGGIGEDGQLQSLFDLYQIKYTGSDYFGSAITMDKNVSKQIMIYHHIKTPKWLFLPDSSLLQSQKEEIGFPMVVKPNDNGSSIGVYILENEEDLLKYLMTNSTTRKRNIIVEQKVLGREFSVGVLGDETLPVIEIVPKTGFFDYESKYFENLSEEIAPADISSEKSSEMRDIALKLHKILNLNIYSRTDFLMNDAGDLYVLEVNSLPGMTPNSLIPKEALAAGIDYPDLCEMIVQKSFERFG